MTKERPHRVLFVSHQASLTGAPFALLHFLRWLAANSDLEFEVLLLRGGPLEGEFAKVAPTRVHQNDSRSSLLHKVETLLDYLEVGRIGPRLRGARYRYRLRHLRRFDVLYLNAAVSFRAARHVPDRWPGAVVAHLHELEVGFDAALARGDTWPAVMARVDRVIACSDAVAAFIVEQGHVDPQRVHRHYELTALPAVPSANAVARLRSELRVPPDAVVVGAVGTVEWRKGPDLFAQLAARLRARRPDRPVIFVWVGARGDEREYHLFRHDIRGAGIDDIVRIVPPVADVAPYYALFDVFALPSREDPFPLVCLEASALGTPVVCFDQGGMPEFVRPDCGVVVPFLNVEAMATAIDGLLDDGETRRRLGANAAAKARAHHSPEAIGPALLREIEEAWTARGNGMSP